VTEQSVQVRFLDAAQHDLVMLARAEPQIIRQVLKRLLLIERNPYVGQPLLGDLIGVQKHVGGDRQWRIVWRVITELGGELVVEVAEVWGVGARAESAVYAEMRRRVANLPVNEQTRLLVEVIESLGRTAMGLRPPEMPKREPVPEWLISRLVFTAGYERRVIESHDAEEAMQLWEKHITRAQING